MPPVPRVRSGVRRATVAWAACVLLLNVAAPRVTPLTAVPSLTVAVPGDGGPIVHVVPFGNNSLRVTASLDGQPIVPSLPGALIPPSERTDATAVLWHRAVTNDPTAAGIAVTRTTITNGNIQAAVDAASGLVTVTRVSDGAVVLNETAKFSGPVTWEGGVSVGCTLELASTAPAGLVGVGPAIYGFGEHQYGRLNRAGQSFVMEQCLEYGHSRGGEVCLPFVLTGHAPASSFAPGASHGCFKDAAQRVLPYAAASSDQNDMTRERCVSMCGSAGYTVAGPEAGGQCYCGNSVPPSSDAAPASDCTYPCEGDASEMCGGNWRVEAIDIVHNASAPTPGAITGGFLWNQPNYGSVSFAASATDTTTWVAVGATQVDYLVVTSSDSDPGDDTSAHARTAPPTASQSAPADILNSYVDAVGHAPVLPEYAAGYWHSRNRYSSQAELLAAAEGFHNRTIPVGIIVIDYHHWVNMGDYSFDPSAWPDPQAMVNQLTAWGMRVMVSVWPFSATQSSTYEGFASHDWAVNTGNTTTPVMWDDNNCGKGVSCLLYDPTQQGAREYLWSALDAGYYKYGIKVFWLDASEPEISTAAASRASNNASWSIGTFQSSGMMFPYWHTRSIHDGLMSAGETEVVMLTRSAWAGMQRWGAALWSGDTQSTFASLQVSVQAGLSTQLSGIAWWTTDVGGYAGGDPSDPTFRNLIVRWFQYGLTCPLLRQHGDRDTAPWLLGNASYAAVVKAIELRASLKDYVMGAMQAVADTGLPVNRPLFWDFADDATAWTVDDEFMFGELYLVAPVTEVNATSRTLYLPTARAAPTQWTHHFTGVTYAGGQTITVDTPLDEFPLFKRSS